MSGNWEWWYGQDGERYDGPCSSKEEAIQRGHDDYDGVAFFIVEAVSATLDFHLGWYSVWELLDDQNSEEVDPDGDSISEQFTQEQRTDLVSVINAAIDGWVARHKVSLRAWRFAEQRDTETIPAKEPS